MTFPLTMRAYLLKISENSWRQIRAQVRWAYMRGNFTPPRKLARYVPVSMPSEPKVWREYANEIPLTRKHIRLQKVTERRKARRIKKLKDRRAYQRDYMREYRQRLRQQTT